jgi:hypothetical protein
MAGYASTTARCARSPTAATSNTVATLDRRAASLRRETIHTFTTRLARRYGTIRVVS